MARSHPWEGTSVWCMAGEKPQEAKTTWTGSPDQSAVLGEGSPPILHPAGLICIPRENLRGDRAQGHGQLCSGLPGSPASGCRDLLTGRNVGGRCPDFSSVRALWVLCRVCHTAFILFVYNVMSSFNSVFPKAGQNKINLGIKRKRI